jgi:PKD repeat protein
MKRLLTFIAPVVLLAYYNRNRPVEPTVGFSVQNNGGKAPCEVSFTSMAKNVGGHLWDFDVGQSARDG